MIVCLCQSLIGTDGIPPTVIPSSIFFITPDLAAILTLLPIFKCPAIPTCPPIITLLPICVLPDIPDWATIIQFFPSTAL